MGTFQKFNLLLNIYKTKYTIMFSKKIKWWREKLTKKTACFAVLIFLLGGFLIGNLFVGSTGVGAEDLCQVDVDVTLVMDVSGSMVDGQASGQCDWWQLELVDTSYQWVMHTDYDVDQAWCDDKDLSSQYPSVFSAATSSKIDSAKSAANSFVDQLGTNDQSALVSFSDTASLDKMLSNDHSATQSAVSSLTAGGATNIGDAIATGTQELDSERANSQSVKAMILLTDGKITATDRE